MKKQKYSSLHENLEPGCFYHVYNRGNNGTNIFFEKRNYRYFLEKYAYYLSDCVDTFAYCLLKNHFHLLIRVKDVFEDLKEPSVAAGTGLHHPDKWVSKQFSSFFISYTKSINKSEGRSGSLFETPFRRIRVTSDVYFTRLVWYIHFNPQKHGFVEDFKEYEYSSYHSLLSTKPSKLQRATVANWFGGYAAFQDFHGTRVSENDFDEFIIEE